MDDSSQDKKEKISNAFLFATPTLIWGFSWTFIKMQEGEVDAMLSVSYRFFIAAAILFLYLFIKKESLRASIKDHIFIFFQGITLFGLNYWLFYLSEYYITSGITAFTFSTIVFMNLFIGSALLRKKLELSLIGTALIGFTGMGIIFLSDFQDFSFENKKLLGLALALVATFSASLGNITSAYNQRRGLKVAVMNAFGMLYGASFIFLLAILRGEPVHIERTGKYIGSLLFLAVFASVIAFGAYVKLIGMIGPERSAYVSFILPIIALGLSSLFEGYSWGWLSLLGILLIFISNLMVRRISSS